MDGTTRLLRGFYIGSAPSRSAGFTYIVLCAQEYQPERRILRPALVRRIPLQDIEMPITPQLRRDLATHARGIADAWKDGHRVLVSCVAGRNRSALISALSLAEITGKHPGTTARYIRRVRIDDYGVHALANRSFWDFLQSYPT